MGGGPMGAGRGGPRRVSGSGRYRPARLLHATQGFHCSRVWLLSLTSAAPTHDRDDRDRRDGYGQYNQNDEENDHLARSSAHMVCTHWLRHRQSGTAERVLATAARQTSLRLTGSGRLGNVWPGLTWSCRVGKVTGVPFVLPAGRSKDSGA